MSSTELVVLREKENGPEILLFYRDDKYFKGWHIPGSIVIPGQTEGETLDRVKRDEIKHKITTPQFIDYMMVQKGTGENEYSRGQISDHIFVSYIEEEYKGDGIFYSLTKIPNDTLGPHKTIIERVEKYLDSTIQKK